MPRVTLYHFEGCPACKNAKEWIKELRLEKPELKDVPVEMVDVHRTPNFKAPAPFYYVPTFFVDGKKCLEGVATKEKVEEILRRGLEV